jgi:hypothetical protein
MPVIGGAVASVPVLEMTTLRFTHSDKVLNPVLGHVMAAAVAVVIYYVVASLVR